MPKTSTVSWCDITWNPVVGCRKVSPGCGNCTAEQSLNRLKGRKLSDYKYGFEPYEAQERLYLPFNWKKPQIILVNSLSDLFLEEISLDYLNKVMLVMKDTPRHRYVISSKRMTHLACIAEQLHWPSNLVLGTSIESHDYLYRLDILKTLPPSLKFVSFQPLIGEVINPDVSGLGWVTCEAESGLNARRVDFNWIAHIKDACMARNVPFVYNANFIIEDRMRKMIMAA